MSSHLLQDEVADTDSGGEKPPDYPSTKLETFWLLTKFMLPLIVTQMVPDIAEQVWIVYSSHLTVSTCVYQYTNEENQPTPNTLSDVLAFLVQSDGGCKTWDNSRNENSNNQREDFSLWFSVSCVFFTVLQALNRGITSIAGDEMVSLLASFGLAFYVTRFLSCGSCE